MTTKRTELVCFYLIIVLRTGNFTRNGNIEITIPNNLLMSFYIPKNPKICLTGNLIGS